ncbi:MAG: hypothetical protein HY331_15570 [Chloroflexi bacterium]|nr:hypothetical protein [Chloroflexota bacterium]
MAGPRRDANPRPDLLRLRNQLRKQERLEEMRPLAAGDRVTLIDDVPENPNLSPGREGQLVALLAGNMARVDFEATPDDQTVRKVIIPMRHLKRAPKRAAKQA